jgi:hypothetical protein
LSKDLTEQWVQCCGECHLWSHSACEGFFTKTEMDTLKREDYRCRK